jgi:stage II sporulation protein D
MRFADERKEKPSSDGSDISVYFTSEDKVITMKTEEYIRGVLMAEMPAEFETEALKAQAVAARSYMAEKSKNIAKDNVHPNADVCTDSSHCQAYISDKDAKKKWGKNADKYFGKCCNAVESTAGVVAVYNGEPIKAVFHSVSGGNTENASDVWSGDVSYLKSVPSPGEESAPKYETVSEFALSDFKAKLKDELGIEYKSDAIGKTTRTEGGAVKSIEIAGTSVKGTDIRRVFGLNSANFEIKTENDKVIFNVTGYGHGVGMSQYGANYCAKQGMDYKEILTKYYSGISFAKLDA